MDDQEQLWVDNPAVVFMIALTDVGQAHSCDEWGDRGIEGTPLIVDDVGSTIFNRFHDSWSAFPTYVILDHTMTVRAKPWPYSNNSNTSSCDGSNSTIDNFNGGDTNNFITQLVEECGSICEPCSDPDGPDTDGDGISDECDDCHNQTGDTNDDFIVNILDIMLVIDIILDGSENFSDCELQDADFNENGIINISDIIGIINIILTNN